MAMEITDANFEQIVLKSDKPVMVDFWATWCGPCRAIAPTIEELSKEFEGKVVVGKVDVDAQSSIPAQYGIRNIPTILFFKNGELVDKLVGASPKADYIKKLNSLL
ncbi:MAG: thioredoxin [Prevotellaceae bacterium]|jgi:thioredoxin 1|nr:thioredoxin [Prevotellaceae bacterium]